MPIDLLYDEKELLEKTAGGDEAAFARLFQRWQPALAAYIFRITKSKEVAAEVVQDVFLKIWMTRETLAGVDSFKNYLLVISRNHAINSLRKAMRELRNFNNWKKENVWSEENVSENDNFSLLDEAVESLPPRQKEVFILHRYERLTYVQVAEKLGIGKESVKTHLALAVKSISLYLKQKTSLLVLLVAALKNF